MSTLAEPSLAVLRLFGRTPSAEDWSCVGRWAYAASWLAEDMPTARELVRARFAGAAPLAIRAAMGAGRGDAERYTLVTALAKLPEAIETEHGTLGAAVDRAVEEAAERLVFDGTALRAQTGRERAAFASRFHLEGFNIAIRDVGQDRHVMLREVAAQLDDALVGMKEPCHALRVMRRFLQATLAMDAYDATAVLEAASSGGGTGPVSTLGLWLTADLALTARRATSFSSAWTTAARVSGDALSRTLAGLTSGAMTANNVVGALTDDPWSLVLALAMTTEPDHAIALLQCGVQAQIAGRVEAERAQARWVAQAARANEFERRLGLDLTASIEAREGHLSTPPLANSDIFTSRGLRCIAEESLEQIQEAMDRSVEAESRNRKEAVKKAKGRVESTRKSHDAALEDARAIRENFVRDAVATFPPEDEAAAQRGCAFGFGAGCSVLAVYVVVGTVIGMGGMMGKIAPVVVGVAALPIAAAIVVQMAAALRRSAIQNEAIRAREKANQEFERHRSEIDRQFESSLREERQRLEKAEEDLALFDRLLAPVTKAAA